jgi:DNA modification methylase
MIMTDPPFGHNNNNGDLISQRESALGKGKAGAPRPIMNDGREANELFTAFITEAKRVLKNDGCCCCCCCCGGGGPDPMFARWSLELDRQLNFAQMVIWDKGPMGMGWRYRRSYETVLVAYKGNKMRWYDDSDRVENIIRPGQLGINKIIPSASQHPTEKPENLAAHFIRLHTQKGDVVLDPFCGSGSFLVAAYKLERKFIGIELDPHWAKMAQARIDAVNPLFGELNGA